MTKSPQSNQSLRYTQLCTFSADALVAYAQSIGVSTKPPTQVPFPHGFKIAMVIRILQHEARSIPQLV